MTSSGFSGSGGHEAADPVAVCADDYGATEDIGVAVRTLAEQRRISATSCMTVSPLWPSEAHLLRPLADRIEIGLHVTLSEGSPLGSMPLLAPSGRFPTLRRLLAQVLARRLDVSEVQGEILCQVDAFEAELGRPPDFLDGHHHVHQFPVIRRAVLEVFEHRLARSGAWMRYAGMPANDVLRHRVAIGRTLVIDALGAGFRRQGTARRIPGNRSFRGVRDFSREPPYDVLMARFLSGIGGGGLLMCHPAAADGRFGTTPFRAERIEEYRVLMSDRFPVLMAAAGATLSGLGRLRAHPTETTPSSA